MIKKAQLNNHQLQEGYKAVDEEFSEILCLLCEKFNLKAALVCFKKVYSSQYPADFLNEKERSVFSTFSLEINDQLDLLNDQGRLHSKEYETILLMDNDKVIIGALFVFQLGGAQLDSSTLKDSKEWLNFQKQLVNLHELNCLKSMKSDSSDFEYEIFMKNLGEHAIVSRMDLEGHVTYVNDRFIEVSGYSQSELLGRTLRKINSGFHPHSFFKNMWSKLSSGKTWRGEVRNRAKDGRLFWVDASFFPLRDASGEIYEFMSIRYDITERKKGSRAFSTRDAKDK